MHELSVAWSLVEAACEESTRMGGARVTVLHVRLGPLSGVVPDALAFSFDLAAAGTAIEGARLHIEPVPIEIRCASCDLHQRVTDGRDLRCPRCGAAAEVVHGHELELRSMEVRDGSEDSRGPAQRSQAE